MTIEELDELLNKIQKMRCETQTLEIKRAIQGCPKRLYDTLSGFSNQDEGGTIIFGVDEDNKKYQDDVREIPRATFESLNQEALDEYIDKLKRGKPNLSNLPTEDIYELTGITRNRVLTLSAVLLFSLYPQAYFPQLCITAVSVPGTEIGSTGERGERFSDNRRIEGSIPEMLEGALEFVKRNMRNMTIINPETGKREDQTDYPLTAVREAIINALVHRDYSIHTEGRPIQILMFSDRMEIHNPGGLYGRIHIDQLGKMQPDTRNPVLASALEIMGITENRYSGIPIIRQSMKKYGLKEPKFSDERGSFIVIFSKNADNSAISDTVQDTDVRNIPNEETRQLLIFCQTPRTRREISDYLGLSSVTYAIQKYVIPLVEQGLIRMSIPERPGSPKQLYYTAEKL